MKENSKVVPSITDSDHEEFIDDNKYVVVDLWASWCSPCIQMNPIIEELAENYDGKVRFAKVNIENNNEIPSKFGVQSLPSYLFFKDGELVGKERGVLKKKQFEEKMKEKFDI
ncbi:MAG: thioredoxin [Candidatus Natronoplasma sp.]